MERPAMKVHLLLDFQPTNDLEIASHSHSQSLTLPGLKINLDHISHDPLQILADLLAKGTHSSSEGSTRNVFVVSTSALKTQHLLYSPSGFIVQSYLHLQEDTPEPDHSPPVTLLLEEITENEGLPVPRATPITGQEELLDQLSKAAAGRKHHTHLLATLRVEEDKLGRRRRQINFVEISQQALKKYSECSDNKENSQQQQNQAGRITDLFSSLFSAPSSNTQASCLSPLCSLLSLLLSRPLSGSHLLFHLHQEDALWTGPVVAYLQSWSRLVRNPSLCPLLQAEIQKQEVNLCRWQEKHKGVVSVLGKCLNIDWGQLQGRHGLVPDCVQRDKYRLSLQKKQQNEDTLAQLEKDIADKEATIRETQEQHQRQLEQLTHQREQGQLQLNHLTREMAHLTNPKAEENTSNNTNNVVFGHPKPKARRRQPSESRDPVVVAPSSTLIAPCGVVGRRSVKNRQPPSGQLVEPVQCPTSGGQETNEVKIEREELAIEILKMVKMIAGQEQSLERVLQWRLPLLSVGLKQQLKSRSWKGGDLLQLKDLLVRTPHQSGYQQWLQGQKVHQRWVEQRQKNLPSPTVTTIRQI